MNIAPIRFPKWYPVFYPARGYLSTPAKQAGSNAPKQRPWNCLRWDFSAVPVITFPWRFGVRSIEDDRCVSRSARYNSSKRQFNPSLSYRRNTSNASKIHGLASRWPLNNLSSNRKAFPPHDRSIDRPIDHPASKERTGSFETLLYMRSIGFYIYVRPDGTWRIKGMPRVKWPRLEFTWNHTTWGPRSRSGIVSLCWAGS